MDHRIMALHSTNFGDPDRVDSVHRLFHSGRSFGVQFDLACARAVPESGIEHSRFPHFRSGGGVMKPNVPYHSARIQGKIARDLYRVLLTRIVRRQVHPPRQLSLQVFAYSGEKTLPEQVASIRSFLKHAGRPQQFTVVSDGSYTAASAAILEKIDSCVTVQLEPPALAPDLPEKIRSYLTNHNTGKQLALIMSLPVNGPAS